MTERHFKYALFDNQGDSNTIEATFDEYIRAYDFLLMMEKANPDSDYFIGLLPHNPDINGIGISAVHIYMARAVGAVHGVANDKIDYSTFVSGWGGFWNHVKGTFLTFSWWFPDGAIEKQVAFMKTILQEIEEKGLWGNQQGASEHFEGRFYED